MFKRRPSSLAPVVLVVAAVLLIGSLRMGAQDPALPKEQMASFLLTAKVVGSYEISKGVTHPWRLTLTDGTLKHDAKFQAINERKPSISFASGGGEVNFVDSYLYNLAAYRVAELLGLDDIMPVTVERKWKGNPGSLEWWIDDVKFEEGERLKLKAQPPDPVEWNNQMHRQRVFSQLVYDTDRNLGNVIITNSWKIWMFDFTRAFRLYKQIKSPGDLQRCDRKLLEKLRALTLELVTAHTRDFLTKPEIEAVMTRRDLLVKHFDTLIAAKGEQAVLY
ncbi:MAG: hypothetical protein HYS05_02605 [Acidobacteria bacterium]|nr:hypothetical protein [Acidobacteriota bacterium]